MSTTVDQGHVLDARALAWLGEASHDAAGAWRAVRVAVEASPEMGLAAGERPTADVEVLAAALASCEFLLAARMHAAASSGSLPLPTRGGMLEARGWSSATARRLARCAHFAADHPSVAEPWAAGTITSEHVDPLARAAGRFTAAELGAVVAELALHWGAWSPASVARFVTAADRMLHPPGDPSGDESGAHQSRDLSFALLGGTVFLSGQLPRVEGELVIAAIDALAERLRSTADPVPAGARRADALIQLVNDAHAAGALPTRGGLPISLTVSVDRTAAGDDVWTTSRGHVLTPGEVRWAACDAAVTPVLVRAAGCAGEGDEQARAEFGPPGGPPASEPAPGGGCGPAARIAALAATMFDTRIPLDVGRTQRTATEGQRRALAVRDRGCIIPGCTVPAEACQTHHLEGWADGGVTSISNLALLCWAHHRQVDLRMWRIRPTAEPELRRLTPEQGAPPGTLWPANHGAPFVVVRTPRRSWRA